MTILARLVAKEVDTLGYVTFCILNIKLYFYSKKNIYGYKINNLGIRRKSEKSAQR